MFNGATWVSKFNVFEEQQQYDKLKMETSLIYSKNV